MAKKTETKKPATKKATPAAKATPAPKPKRKSTPPKASAVAAIRKLDTAALGATLAKPENMANDVALMFANEVSDRMYPAAAAQVAQFDPNWILGIAELIMNILKNCPKSVVEETLKDCQHRPNGLKARWARIQLANRLPWKGMSQTFQLSKACIEAGVANINGELWDLAWGSVAPQAAPAPAPAHAVQSVGPAGGANTPSQPA